MSFKSHVKLAYLDVSSFEDRSVYGLSLYQRMILSVAYAGINKIIINANISVKNLPKGTQLIYSQNFQPDAHTLIINQPFVINQLYIKRFLEYSVKHEGDSLFYLSYQPDLADRYSICLFLDKTTSLLEIKQKLADSLRKEQDTLLAILFNRYLSTRMTLFISRWSFLTPTFITMLALFLGMLGIYILCTNHSHFSSIIAGVLIYFSSLLDGVDGELARLKYQFSKLGLWIDNIVDEYLNFMLIISSCIYSYHITQNRVFLKIIVFSVSFFILGKIIQYIAIMLKWQSEDISQYEVPQLKSGKTISKKINLLIYAVSTIPRADMMKFMIMIAAIFQFIPIYAYSTSIFSFVFLIGVIISTMQVKYYRKK